MSDGLTTVLLFPGQGAHKPEMLDYAAGLPSWPAVRKRLAEIAGFDPAALVEREGEAALRRNEVTSLLTVAVSVACLDVLRERGATYDAVAGYSVGQYCALYAAGVLERDEMLARLAESASLMNATRAASGGRMMAVIGLKDAVIQDVCAAVSTADEPVAIANFNCPGQVTISATAAGMVAAEPALRARKPLHMASLPVSGAWHCELLRPAVAPMAERLSGSAMALPLLPVIDNVTGRLFPDDITAIRANMAEQLARPVLWRQGVSHLIEHGARRFVEVGYGEMLSRFGLFIDRSREFVRWDKPA